MAVRKVQCHRLDARPSGEQAGSGSEEKPGIPKAGTQAEALCAYLAPAEGQDTGQTPGQGRVHLLDHSPDPA